jgi:hypothetical protein
MAELRHEPPQVHTTRVLAIAGGTLALLVLIAFGFEALFHDRTHQTYTVQTPFPLPGVVPNERERRLALEHYQRAALNGAGGRMPIARAMDAIAAKGARAFDPVGP